jgi:hypothetical protein
MVMSKFGNMVTARRMGATAERIRPEETFSARRPSIRADQAPPGHRSRESDDVSRVVTIDEAAA